MGNIESLCVCTAESRLASSPLHPRGRLRRERRRQRRGPQRAGASSQGPSHDATRTGPRHLSVLDLTRTLHAGRNHAHAHPAFGNGLATIESALPRRGAGESASQSRRSPGQDYHIVDMSSSDKKFIDKAIKNLPDGDVGSAVMAPVQEGVEEGYGSKTPKTGHYGGDYAIEASIEVLKSTPFDLAYSDDEDSQL